MSLLLDYRAVTVISVFVIQSYLFLLIIMFQNAMLFFSKNNLSKFTFFT